MRPSRRRPADQAIGPFTVTTWHVPAPGEPIGPVIGPNGPLEPVACQGRFQVPLLCGVLLWHVGNVQVRRPRRLALLRPALVRLEERPPPNARRRERLQRLHMAAAAAASNA